MALGSSAPEILLSVIEIVGNNMEAGELGPGTIVGSAAFNLLCISAVCVAGVPKVTNSLILASHWIFVNFFGYCTSLCTLLVLIAWSVVVLERTPKHRTSNTSNFGWVNFELPELQQNLELYRSNIELRLGQKKRILSGKKVTWELRATKIWRPFIQGI